MFDILVLVDNGTVLDPCLAQHPAMLAKAFSKPCKGGCWLHRRTGPVPRWTKPLGRA